jgi:hypothetical protein
MTADEFERAYAERSGLSVAGLRGLGRIVVACRCGGDDCEGWASVSKENAVDYEPGEIYGPPETDALHRTLAAAATPPGSWPVR